MATENQTREKIIIVGAGFGGLAAAQGLRKSPARVLLIDQRNHHLFQPMLYQVAIGQLMPSDIGEPLRKLFGNDPVVAPRMDAVNGVDLDARCVHFSSGQRADYDTLILATGARFQYLGHPDWQPHVLTLKNLEQAMTMRERIFAALEKAGHAESDTDRRDQMTFVIVGAGPTGVEVAGALGRLLPGIIKNQFRQLEVSELRIVLIDPLAHTLAGMHEPLSRYADRELAALGVTLRLRIAVEEIGARHVRLDNGECIQAATIIWAAGMEGTGAGDWLPERLVNKHNKVPVGPDLTVPDHPEVFVIGDAAAATDEDENPYPGLASVAKQQGDYVASRVRDRLAERGGRASSRFQFTDYGTMAIIANGRAVGEIRGHDIKGFVAWLVWGIVHLHFLVSSSKRLLVLTSWIWSMLVNRGQRVILGSIGSHGDDKRPHHDDHDKSTTEDSADTP
jgi:NADH dehydrogenase